MFLVRLRSHFEALFTAAAAVAVGSLLYFVKVNKIFDLHPCTSSQPSLLLSVLPRLTSGAVETFVKLNHITKHRIKFLFFLSRATLLEDVQLGLEVASKAEPTLLWRKNRFFFCRQYKPNWCDADPPSWRHAECEARASIIGYCKGRMTLMELLEWCCSSSVHVDYLAVKYI